MIKAGIIGSAGYTGGELVRLLVNHPEVSISYAQSTSQAGKSVSSHHTDLVGETNLKFTGDFHFEVDVIFLCGGHGKSIEFMASNNVPGSVKIIDLSNDFRLKKSGEGFVYGLPELNKNEISQTNRVANPGCFATAIQLALLPLASSGLIREDLHVHAITGSTGAGAGLSPTSHFSWRNNNVSVYKAFTHQHLAEIGESLKQAQENFSSSINFIPVRGNFSRGILANAYTVFDGTTEDALRIYTDYYKDSVFTHIVDFNPEVKQVVNTNKCYVYPTVHEGKLFVISVLDNLLKGASGQAVQNMNLMFGLEEDLGLNLKASAF